MKRKALSVFSMVIIIGILLSRAAFDLPSLHFYRSDKFLVSSCSDMRLFLCEYPTLTNRVSRNVCLVDLICPTNNPQFPITREVKVGGGLSLAEVVKLSGIEGRGRQIRVFSKNTIYQSPISEIANDPDWFNFIQKPVTAGDLVVITVTKDW